MQIRSNKVRLDKYFFFKALKVFCSPILKSEHTLNCSLADPDPNPDLYVFWTPRIHWSEVLIRILLSFSKNSRKNLDSYFFVTSFGLSILHLEGQ